MFKNIKRPDKTILNRLFILLLFSGSFILYILNNAHESIRYEEALGLSFTRSGLGDLIKGIAVSKIELLPPFYHLLLKVISMISGKTIAVLRGVSALFGSFLVLVMYHYVKKMFNLTVALFTVALLMFTPAVLSFSQEIRMYTLGAFLTVLNLFSFYFAIHRSSANYHRKLFYTINKHWIVFFITGVIGLYTHYFFMITFLITISYMIWFLINGGDGKCRNIILLYGCIIAGCLLFFLPWLPVLFSHLKSLPAGRGLEPFRISLLIKVAGIFFTTRFGYDVNGAVPYYYIIMVFILVINLSLIIFMKKNRGLPGKMILIMFSFLIPFFITILLSIILSPAIISSFMLFFPFLILIIALSIYQLKYKILRILILLPVLLLFLNTNIATYTERFNGKSGELIQFLESEITGTEPVLCFDKKTTFLLTSQMDNQNIFFYPEPALSNSMENDEWINSFLQDNRSFLAVFDTLPASDAGTLFKLFSLYGFGPDHQTPSREFISEYSWAGYKVYRFVKGSRKKNYPF